MGAAATVVAAAFALFVGVFLYFSNKYGNEDLQVSQNITTAAPGNELPVAPLTPPGSPPTPSDTPPVNQ